jgi:hypothetical protein
MTIRVYVADNSGPSSSRMAYQISQSMQSINSPDVTKRDHFAFGAGRRVCKYTDSH